MPERIRRSGVAIAPAHSTMRSANIAAVPLPRTVTTPFARLPSKSNRSTSHPV